MDNCRVTKAVQQSILTICQNNINVKSAHTGTLALTYRVCVKKIRWRPQESIKHLLVEFS